MIARTAWSMQDPAKNQMNAVCRPTAFCSACDVLLESARRMAARYGGVRMVRTPICPPLAVCVRLASSWQTIAGPPVKRLSLITSPAVLLLFTWAAVSPALFYANASQTMSHVCSSPCSYSKASREYEQLPRHRTPTRGQAESRCWTPGKV